MRSSVFAKGAVLAAALFCLPASAAEETVAPTGPITGVLSVRNGGSTPTAVNTTIIEGLRSKEQCLAIAWVASVRNNDTWMHKEANIACLQGEAVVAAQTCVNGNCKGLEP